MMKPLTRRAAVVIIGGLLMFQSYASGQENRLVVNVDLGKESINRNIYGHFAEHLGRCIYGGFWVGEESSIPNTRGMRNDVIDALKELHIPVLRWPGGCFADDYHWMDGIGPRDERPTMINTHWGGITEDNSFGTHEFMDLCELLDCEPYISANLGSGTVREMAKWVEYLTSDAISPMTDLRKKNGREKPWKIKYWGLGNESWGCGGSMTPEYYADIMRHYSTYARNFGGNRLYKIASGANTDDYDWTETLIKNPRNRHMMNAMGLHYYTVAHDWSKKRSATEFDENDWFLTISKTLKMNELINKHTTIMDKYDPDKNIDLLVDEWGNWHDVEPGTNPGFLYQQNTLRDALVAAINLNIFNNHCDRVKMANIAQTINVLQAMILTKEEEMVLTPSYYVYKMFRVHQDAEMLPINLMCADYKFGDKSIPAVNASASKDKNGIIHISLTNSDPHNSVDLECELRGLEDISSAKGEIITSSTMNAFNDFGKQEEVASEKFDDIKVKNRVLKIKLPAKSVAMIKLAQ
jgi:alpha-L-arabinofuranosidase